MLERRVGGCFVKVHPRQRLLQEPRIGAVEGGGKHAALPGAGLVLHQKLRVKARPSSSKHRLHHRLKTDPAIAEPQRPAQATALARML